MPTFLSPVMLTWVLSALAVAGVITRPFRLPEAVWAVLGAAVIAALGLMPLSAVWTGIARGTDVYLFLIGMMLLSELARKEGLFDWLAAIATRHAKGSPKRLFFLIYAVGVLVTVFLSNDATAVVLTPAVYAATRAAKVANPLPYLLICAFIANAASF
ncbi:MAG: SLC13 family permease, partial [Pararhizobium sp.]